MKHVSIGTIEALLTAAATRAEWAQAYSNDHEKCSVAIADVAQLIQITLKLLKDARE